ncbi:uncharacterized protein RSE6_09665 [Rhynchosporium secalis]|uniref:Extracellular membrane protein CFEM domain-containing protein n=1 Tax=Rhynchosporium secalis TaxID=38038 RepID=A0A1E1MII2_RHYSE|nr:uncharacterized protein RSE6_09665 [Rhynchosporium secalis]
MSFFFRNSFVVIVFTLLVHSASASSQSLQDQVSQLPDCSKNCISLAAANAGCVAGDYACQCKAAGGQNFLGGIISNVLGSVTGQNTCLLDACGAANAANTQMIFKQICDIVRPTVSPTSIAPAEITPPPLPVDEPIFTEYSTAPVAEPTSTEQISPPFLSASSSESVMQSSTAISSPVVQSTPIPAFAPPPRATTSIPSPPQSSTLSTSFPQTTLTTVNSVPASSTLAATRSSEPPSSASAIQASSTSQVSPTIATTSNTPAPFPTTSTSAATPLSESANTSPTRQFPSNTPSPASYQAAADQINSSVRGTQKSIRPRLSQAAVVGIVLGFLALTILTTGIYLLFRRRQQAIKRRKQLAKMSTMTAMSRKSGEITVYLDLGLGDDARPTLPDVGRGSAYRSGLRGGLNSHPSATDIR